MLYGRDGELREILAHSEAGRMVVLTGPPGLGKTTFLKEGLAPALRAKGFIVAVFSDWQGRSITPKLKETIAQAVREQADDTFVAQTETLAQMLSGIRAQTSLRVAVLLDQAEDYIRCHAGTDLAHSFDAELAQAVAGRESWFVIAAQEHAVSSLQTGCEMRLGPLEAAAAKEVVMQSGKTHGIIFEPEVIEALVTAPAAQFKQGVHPWYLMAGVERLLDAGREKKWTTVDMGMIQIYGGADRLILESLDEKLNKLTETEKELFFRWFHLLISDSNQRLAVTETGLLDYSGKLNKFGLRLTQVLLELNILQTFEVSETVRYEIACDSFVPLLRDWWARTEPILIARRRARFGVRSVSLAVGSIVALYALWLIATLRQ